MDVKRTNGVGSMKARIALAASMAALLAVAACMSRGLTKSPAMEQLSGDMDHLTSDASAHADRQQQEAKVADAAIDEGDAPSAKESIKRLVATEVRDAKARAALTAAATAKVAAATKERDELYDRCQKLIEERDSWRTKVLHLMFAIGAFGTAIAAAVTIWGGLRWLPAVGICISLVVVSVVLEASIPWIIWGAVAGVGILIVCGAILIWRKHAIGTNLTDFIESLKAYLPTEVLDRFFKTSPPIASQILTPSTQALVKTVRRRRGLIRSGAAAAVAMPPTTS